MTSLIALCSPAMRSGKSTVAEHLVDSFGFQKVSFATPIKAMTVALLEAAGANPEEIERRVYGDLKDVGGPALLAAMSFLSAPAPACTADTTLRDE